MQSKANLRRGLVLAVGVAVCAMLAASCGGPDPLVRFRLRNPCPVALEFDSWWIRSDVDSGEPDTSTPPETYVVEAHGEQGLLSLVDYIVIWEVQEIGFRERYWVPYEGQFHSYPDVEVRPDPSLCPPG